MVHGFGTDLMPSIELTPKHTQSFSMSNVMNGLCPDLWFSCAIEESHKDRNGSFKEQLSKGDS